MNRLDHVHMQCGISLHPNPHDREKYFIDLQDGRVLISTLDLKWIKSCYHRPPQAINGCSNCVLHKSCNCSLSSKSFYITNSVHMCSKTEATETEIVPIIWQVFHISKVLTQMYLCQIRLYGTNLLIYLCPPLLIQEVSGL